MAWVEAGAVICRSFIHRRTWSPVLEDTDQASTVDNAGPLHLVKASVRRDMQDVLEGRRYRWRPIGDDQLVLEVWER